MQKSDLFNHLEKIADILEFNNENVFKINSYRNAANALRKINSDIEQMIIDKSIMSIKGIGKSIFSVIEDFQKNGNSSIFQELTQSIPESLFEIFQIRGLGPKKISILFHDFGITSLGELEYFCKENRVLLLKGFGAKTQEKILSEIERIKDSKRFLLLSKADELNELIQSIVCKFPQIEKILPTGEIRRTDNIISKIEYVLQISNYDDFVKQFEKRFSSIEIFKNEIIVRDYSVPIYFYPISEEKIFYQKLFETTGSTEFVKKLYLKPDSIKNCSSEEEIFQTVNHIYIEPERREEEFFNNYDKPYFISDLTESKLKGFFHFHTNYSDGINGIAEMVVKAKERGYSYFVVCDHSKSAFYANGLSEERVIKQKEAIKSIVQQDGLNIFQGIESDILIDGSLDYSNDFLPEFDFIVASVHSQFNLSEKEMTERIIKAVENPFTDLLGHPTGRLLLSREPYKVNIKKIIDACVQNKTAIELNASPYRLDLDWRNIFYAREKGCIISINTDAHSLDDVDCAKYGIMVARKAGLLCSEVLNCFEIEKFKKYLKRKVNRKLTN